MKTVEYFKKKAVLSFEVFPPKPTGTPIREVLDGLKGLSPDYINVTYGAGGSRNSDATFQIASMIRDEYGIESVPHLACIELTRPAAEEALEKLKQSSAENVMALRGDRPKEPYTPGDFAHAGDLVAFLRERSSLNIVAACYPEGHLESPDWIQDILNLKTKVDAGVNQLITQFFLDNHYFYAFMEHCRLAGIHVPVSVGVMPVISKRQIERMAPLCGAHIPEKFAAMVAHYESNPAALQEAGIAYAIDQIADLLSHGVKGIHLYTMNNPAVTQRICEAIRPLMA